MSLMSSNMKNQYIVIQQGITVDCRKKIGDGGDKFVFYTRQNDIYVDGLLFVNYEMNSKYRIIFWIGQVTV